MDPCVIVTLTTCLLLLSSSAANGWLFWRSYPSARSRGMAVDPACLALAMEGSCDFYLCFEQRLECGKNWYNVKYGEPYCRDFKAYYNRFSETGQKFINASQVCISNELLNWYERSKIDCHDYTHFAFKALSRCYMKSGFCEAMRSDGINFATIFQPKHLFSRGALKIWREILRLTYFCEPQAVKDVVMTFYESIHD
ncbi:stanniocalcin-like protein [Plakobranchus ocellatus]|uniref:Stanniocalcin-like protein n=1 Tax=Plakobranchus ocellatus TaxID=259542 RepID=A0AAV3YIR3_9GAST|nr:stanniocalcin-like protein [Plakobranchus ocellatus]